MSEFNAKTLCVLGRQPALGLAELESLYGANHVQPAAGGFALLDIDPWAISFSRLGGTIKIARVLTTLPYTNWESVGKYLREKIPEHLKQVPDGKFTLGVSVYNLDVKPDHINKNNLAIKKQIKASGRPVRIVPNKTVELNSAQVLHNKLTHLGAWELLLVREGKQTILAQTLFVQDIDAYAARDQVRPKRDSRVGMLPPKLAQIIVNLATGPVPLSPADEQSPPLSESSRASAASKAPVLTQRITDTPLSAPRPFLAATPSADPVKSVNKRRLRLLDPFCGTGTLLQEAMLMGYDVIGTDIEPRMVEYSHANLKWLVEKHPKLESYADVELADATDNKWSGFSIVASEVFLGRPLAKMPNEADLKQIISDANTIIKKFLTNVAPQMKPGQRMCLAVPAWLVNNDKRDKSAGAVLGADEKRSEAYIKYGERASKSATTHSTASSGKVSGPAGKQADARFIFLPLLAKLTDMGYNYLDLKNVKREELLYYRADQLVARQLVILEKA